MPDLNQSFSLNGFATLGTAYNSSDRAAFIRDTSQPKGPSGDLYRETDGRVGAQDRWRPRDGLEAVLQIAGEYRSDGSYRPTQTWGHVEYAFRRDLELRAGRIGFDRRLNGSTGALRRLLRSTRLPIANPLAGDLRHSQGDDVFLAAGIAHDRGPWRIQGGSSHVDTDNLAFPGSTAGALSIGYRIGQWTPSAMCARAVSEHPRADSGLPPLHPYSLHSLHSLLDGYAQTITALNQFDQNICTLGARFDFARNAALKLDWTHCRDNPTLSWLDADPEWNGRSTPFSRSMDIVF